MVISRTGHGAEDGDISREVKAVAIFKRKERLSTKFGGGKFGGGKFSRKKIIREKNL
jgi:hypothetical protein